MLKHISCLFMLFLAIFDAGAQNFIWVKQYEGDASGEVYGISLDGSGNIYTMGLLDGSVDFDPGPGTFYLTSPGNNTDVFITKSDPSGNLVWAKQIESTSIVYGYAMTTDGSGNVYTTGWFAGTADFDPGPGVFNITAQSARDIFICKLDASGNFVWAKQLKGSENERGYGITVDQTGNVYTTGMFEGTVDFDPGPGTHTLNSDGDSDAYVCKLDVSGNYVWAVQFGGQNPDEVGRGIAVDLAGNVYTTGWFLGTADFDPGPGIYNLVSAGGEDIFISKLDPSGNFLWARNQGDVNEDRSLAIVTDSNGNAYVTGYSNADYNNAYLFKYDPQGTPVWLKSFDSEICSDLDLDASGNIYVIGFFSGTDDFDPGPGKYWLSSSGDYDVFISKLDNNGNHIWAGQFGGTLESHGRSIKVDQDGYIFSTGTFQGTADFDPGPGTTLLTSAGSFDVFIHKMKPFEVAVPESQNTPLIRVCPNPTEGNVNLCFNQNHATISIKVRNIYGQTVSTSEFNNTGSITFDLPGSKGLYILEIKADDNLPVKYKILKK